MADPYFSEIKYLGGPTVDFIEVAVDSGTDVSDLEVTIYLSGGAIRTTNLLAGLTPTTIAGKDVYLIDTASSGSFNGLGKTNGLSLSDDTTVFAFFSFDDLATPITATEGPADGLTSTQIGMAGSGESLETNDGGATYFVQTSPNPGTVPCFTFGTGIQTPYGQTKVEDLQRGMRVTTADDESKDLLAVLRTTVTAEKLAQNPKLYPVRITAGALGKGLPCSDLLVSQQHRMLVASPIVKRMFGVLETLIAAIRLVDLPGIYVDLSVREVTYFHLLFRDHEVIFAEGAPTESFFLGAEAIKILPEECQTEIETIFANLLISRHVQAPGRYIPLGRQQNRLIARHVVNQKALLATFGSIATAGSDWQPRTKPLN